MPETGNGGLEMSWFVRLAQAVEKLHNAGLLFERVGFVWLARVGLLAVVAANADKARWVAAEFSEPGAWSPYLLAYGVELVFAIGAYWLAHRLQTGDGRLVVLVGVVITFAVISGIANVAYFEAHRPDMTAWNLVQAIALGIAAPGAAVAIAFLTGDLSAVSEKQQEQRQALERLALEQGHERAMLELEVEQARQARLTANAKARQAKALAGESLGRIDGPAVRGLVPAKASPTDGEPWTYEQFVEYVEAHNIDVFGKAVTGGVVAEWAGVSARTGRNWIARYREGIDYTEAQ